jgi:hypothetical protein
MSSPESWDRSGAELDATLRLLASEQRRHLLYLLREHDSFTLAELADILTGWLVTRREVVATPEDRQRIYTKLYHVDVQKLVDWGYVAFDEASGEVTLAELPPGVDHLLDCALELEPETTSEMITAADTGDW